mmetsp:Transcript_310/g.728  ORF Transcript_310/g.728 Transcript_310/m.728 type:complete len:229 (+) Transcript_310:2009-2695(+)
MLPHLRQELLQVRLLAQDVLQFAMVVLARGLQFQLQCLCSRHGLPYPLLNAGTHLVKPRPPLLLSCLAQLQLLLVCRRQLGLSFFKVHQEHQVVCCQLCHRLLVPFGIAARFGCLRLDPIQRSNRPVTRLLCLSSCHLCLICALPQPCELTLSLCVGELGSFKLLLPLLRSRQLRLALHLHLLHLHPHALCLTHSRQALRLYLAQALRGKVQVTICVLQLLHELLVAF